MKETDLAIFYQVGKCFLGMNFLEAMRPSLTDPVGLLDAVRLLNGPDLWLKDFLTETEGMEMSDSRAAARRLRVTVVGLFGDLAAALRVNVKNAQDAIVTSETIARFHAELEEFEEAFMRDCRQLNVFTVTPRGFIARAP